VLSRHVQNGVRWALDRAPRRGGATSVHARPLVEYEDASGSKYLITLLAEVRRAAASRIETSPITG
jgi:hypothetical protein